jgi:Secretion system C-terminal sorting domain/Beta-propeller repeat
MAMQKKYTLNALEFSWLCQQSNKMKSALLTTLFFITGWCNQSYSQNLGWAKRLGGTDYEHGRSVAIDASGNVYTTGEFRGTADFDPGPGTYNLTSFSPCCYDIFISKLDASGNFLWAKQLGGTNIDLAFSIKVDAAGNVYTTGDFEGTADFDPGSGVYSLTSAGSTDIFVLKLDASGNFIWVAQMGGSDNFAGDLDHSRSIAVDAAGNVYTTGSFFGTSDFDPGAGVYNLVSNYTFEDDVFISKLDVNGNFVWAKQFAGTASEEGVSIAVDGNGNIYTTGIFYNTTDFDPGPAIYNMTPVDEDNYQNYDIYISKLDANGNFVWAKQLGGPHITASFLYDNSYGIAVDAAGNVYTTGSFPGTVDFDPGPGIYNMTAAGPNALDIFISKLDAAGNFVWAKQMGGTFTDVAYAIAVDASQNVYTTGYFQGTADFDPGPGVYNLTTTGGNASADDDIFVSKLDASGNFVSAEKVGGLGLDYAIAIAVDASQNIYTAGYFGSTADFDPGVGVYNLVSPGADDVFVLKLISNALPVKLLNFSAKVNDNKEVDISWTTASELNNQYFTIERSKDGLNFEQVAIVKGAINSSIAINYLSTDKTPYSGKSYYRLRQTDLDGKYSFSAIVQLQLNTANSNEFTIYPNPVQRVLHVQLTASANKSIVWQVQDATGKILKQQSDQLHGSSQSIDVSGLPNGMYYLVLKKDDGTTVKKFIKQ